MVIPPIEDVYVSVITNYADGGQTQMIWIGAAGEQFREQLIRMLGRPTYHVVISPESLQERLDLFAECSVLIEEES